MSPNAGFGVYSPENSSGQIEPAQIVFTGDGGRTWHQVGPSPVPHGNGSTERPVLAFADTSDGVVYGTGGAFATHDGGRTWTAIPVSGTALDVAVAGSRFWLTDTTCPPSPSTAPCTVGVETSSDAGRTWSALTLPPGSYRAAQAAPLPGGTLLVAEWAAQDYPSPDPGMLLRSEDNGATWHENPLPCPAGYRLGGQMSVAPSRSTIWLVCAGQGSGGTRGVVLFRSADLGATWTPESSYALGGMTTVPPGAPAGQIEALAARSPTDAWVLQLNGGLVASSDGGRTWHDDMPPAMRTAIDGLLGTLDVVDATCAYVAGWSGVAGFGGLWRTTDAGTTWQRVR